MPRLARHLPQRIRAQRVRSSGVDCIDGGAAIVGCAGNHQGQQAGACTLLGSSGIQGHLVATVCGGFSRGRFRGVARSVAVDVQAHHCIAYRPIDDHLARQRGADRFLWRVLAAASATAGHQRSGGDGGQRRRESAIQDGWHGVSSKVGRCSARRRGEQVAGCGPILAWLARQRLP